MAKRKRINKRVVLLLVVLGVIVLAGGVTLAVRRLPKDPRPFVQRGDEAAEQGEYSRAQYEYLRAVGYTQDAEGEEARFAAEIRYKVAMLQQKMLDADPTMSTPQRRKRHSRYYDMLDRSCRVDPTFEPAHRKFAELRWQIAQAENTRPGGVRENAPVAWTDYISAVDELLQLAPQDDQIYFRRATAKMFLSLKFNRKSEYSEGAIDDFKKAVELKSDEAEYWISLSQMLWNLNDRKQSEEVITEALAQNPDNATLRIRYAVMLQQEDRSDESLKQIQEAIKRAPDDPAGRLALAQTYASKKEYEKALEEVEKARKIDDKNILVYDMLVRLNMLLKQPQRALDAIRRAVKVVNEELDTQKDQEDLQERIKLETSRVRLAYLRGIVALTAWHDQVGQERDLKLLDEIDECLQTLATLSQGGAMHRAIAGRLAFAREDWTEAIKHLEAARELFKASGLRGDPQVMFDLYRAYLLRRLPGKANGILDELATLPHMGENVSVLIHLAEQRIRAGDYAGTAKLLDRAIAADPDNALARRNRAIVAVVLFDTDLSAERLSRQLNLTQDMAESKALRYILRMRTSELVNSGDRQGAIRLLEAVNLRYPAAWNPVQLLANQYIAIDQDDQALKLLDRTEAADPRLAKAVGFFRSQMLAKNPQEQLTLALALIPDSDNPLDDALKRARYCLRFKDLERHIEYVREAEKIDPNNQLVIGFLFSHAKNAGDWDQAEQYVQRLPKYKQPALRATLAKAQGDMIKAIEYMEEALVAQPQSKAIGSVLGDYYLGQAREERKAGRSDAAQQYTAKAEKQFQDVIELDPRYSLAVIGMAKATSILGKTEESIVWLEKARRIKRNDPVLELLHIANVERQGDDIDELIELRDQYGRKFPKDINNALKLAALYEQRGDLGKAERMYRFVLAGSGGSMLGLDAAIDFYGRIGKYEVARAMLAQLSKGIDTKQEYVLHLLYGRLFSHYDLAAAEAAYGEAIANAPDNPVVRSARAKFYAGRRRWAKAVDDMKAYIELSPKDINARIELASYLIQTRQYDEALRYIEDVLAADPNNTDVKTLKGMVYSRRRQYLQADEILTQAVKESSGNIRALLYRAENSLRLGKTDKARSDLRRVMSLTANPMTMMKCAELFVLLKDYAEAEKVCRGILRRRQNYAPAHEQLIRLLINQKRFTQAGTAINKAVQQFPDSVAFPLLGADVWKETGDSAKAIQAFKRAVSISRENPEIVGKYLIAMLEFGMHQEALDAGERYSGRQGYQPWLKAVQARALAKLGQQQQAEKLFIEAFKQLKDDQSAYMSIVISQVMGAFGPDVGADKLQAWASLYKPQDWRMALAVGRICRASEKHEQAMKALQRARSLAPGETEQAVVARELGTTYNAMEEFAQAARYYRQVLDVFPDDVTVLNNLAYIYADKMNRADEALTLAKKAVSLRPIDPYVLDTYGWAMAKTGTMSNLIDAERELKRAKQLGDSGPIHYQHLAWVYEQLKRHADALQECDAGIKVAIERNDKQARLELEQIRARVELRANKETVR